MTHRTLTSQTMIIACSICLLTLCAPRHARADIAELKNGQLIEVVILAENDTSYTARCNVGMIALNKDTILNIQEFSPEVNRSLLEKWKAQATSSTQSSQKSKQPKYPQSVRKVSQEKTQVQRKTWQEKMRDEKKRVADMTEDMIEDKLHAETKELVAQGERRRSNEAKTILSNHEWKHYKTNHCLIFFQKTATGDILEDKSEFFFTKIASDLGLLEELSENLDHRIEIFAIESPEIWQEVLRGKNLPVTPNGFSKVYKKEIFLYITTDYDIEFVLPHELTQVLFREYVNIKFNENVAIPLWLYEGFSNFQGNIINMSATEELLRIAIRYNTYMPLADLLSISQYPKNASEKSLFYAESTKLIQYIYLRYGRLQFLEFIDLFLNEYYKATTYKQSLTKDETRDIFKNVLSSSFLNNDFTGFNNFEENWLKSITKIR